QRENQLGIGKDKRTANRLAKEEELKAAGVGRMGRLIRGRTFAAGQKAAASVTMTEDAYNRKAREMRRTGGFDYLVSGVRGSDLDTAEDEAYKAAYAMHEEEQGAKFPHKYEDARNKEFEGIVYK